jgi:zinc and cadmium transporter
LNYLFILLVALPVLVGAGYTYLHALNKQYAKPISIFTAALLLCITVINFLPEVFEHVPNKSYAGIVILLGLLLQLGLERFSNGLEHGHLHNAGQVKFYISYVALLLHSFVEGTPLLISVNGNSLLVGLIVHNVPVTIILMQLIKHLNYSTFTSLSLISMLGISTVGGAFAAQYITQYTHLAFDVHYVLAFVCGLFLHIGTSLLFEFNRGKQQLVLKLFLVALALGLCLLLR